jgi:ADP-heptose:LPS heptosyltransferase
MSAPRYLIVRFSAIGDCVMAAWAATAIRQKHPDAFLAWAVEGRCAPVIDRYSLVTQRHEFPRDKWKLRRWSPQTWREQVVKYLRLRKLDFDFGVDLQGHSKTALCLYLANPRERISAGGTDGLSARLNPIKRGRPEGMHTVEWNNAVIETFDDFQIPERPILPDVPSDREPDLVTISVSAGHPDKAYPAENWRVIAEKLLAEGFRVTFLGGPSDTPIDLPGSTDCVGKLRLKETLSKVAKSAVHLAADTGTGHMAAAVGTPVVSIFGPTDPRVYRPYCHHGTVLKVSDRPSDVSVEVVLEAAHGYLARALR